MSEVGDAVEITFTATAGATVTAAVTPPGGQPTEAVPVSESGPGEYPYQFLLTAAGVWQVRFTAAGTVTAVESFHVFAEAGQVPLATAAQVGNVWRPLSDAEQAVVTARLAQASRMLRQRFPDLDARIADGRLDPSLAADAAVGMVLRLVRLPGGLRSETTGPFRRDYIVDGEAATAQPQITQAEVDLIAAPSATGGKRRGVGTIRVQSGLAPIPMHPPGVRRVRFW